MFSFAYFFDISPKINIKTPKNNTNSLQKQRKLQKYFFLSVGHEVLMSLPIVILLLFVSGSEGHLLFTVFRISLLAEIFTSNMVHSCCVFG